MNRKGVVVGNWKMELSHKASVGLAKSLASMAEDMKSGVDVVVCPSFVSLGAVKDILKDSLYQIGAQHVHYKERGAYTGEVSVVQLAGLTSWCLIGHSEHRALSRQTDEEIAVASGLLLQHGISPVLCFGENAGEREAGETVDVVMRQLGYWLEHTNRVEAIKTTLAYEPIWAIGTGVLPNPDDVAEVVLSIRKMIAGRFDAEAAGRVCILYGGSVKPETAGQYVGGPMADGVLVGGASLHPRQFLDIVKEVDSKLVSE